MQWKRDQIEPHPQVANGILLAGAVVHFFLCMPLYGRRGYPEIDPIWLSMVWMWIPAIPISALFSKFSRSRFWALILYATATSFTVSWSLVLIVPSRRGPIEALIDMALMLITPALMVAVLGVEFFSRRTFLLVRRFTPEPYCEKCGYNILHLQEPRCPECGIPFDPMWLDHDTNVPRTPRRCYFITAFLLLFLVAITMFPSAYDWHARHKIAARGRAQAKLDWQAGEATWYLTRSEEKSLPNHIVYKVIGTDYIDPKTGLRIGLMLPDWEYHTFHTAYRSEIESILGQAGKSPPQIVPNSHQISPD